MKKSLFYLWLLLLCCGCDMITARYGYVVNNQSGQDITVYYTYKSSKKEQHKFIKHGEKIAFDSILITGTGRDLGNSFLKDFFDHVYIKVGNTITGKNYLTHRKNWSYTALQAGKYIKSNFTKVTYTLKLDKNNLQAALDTIDVPDSLSIYRVDTCLANLLVNIVKSNRKLYDPKKYFFGLALSIGKTYRVVNINADLWQEAFRTKYKGAIKYGEFVFLCYGDIEKDPMFHKTNLPPILVNLKLHVKKANDFPFNNEPLLQGVLAPCEGLPIYIEVYAEGGAANYKMDFSVKHTIDFSK